MSNNKPLNWGIVSTANINRRVIPALNAATRSNLLAVASRSLPAAQSFAAKWNISQTFDSYEALLAAPEINAVYIPLPNHLHAEWSIKAAEAGKHILCEKPLALRVADVNRMADATRANGVVLMEAFMYRTHPIMSKLKSLIAEGLIGQVKLVRAKFSFTLSDDNNVRLKKDMGGGSLWDVGCYPVSFSQAISESAPVEVMAWQRLNHNGVEVGFSGQMRYADGIIAQIDSGFDIPFRIGAEIVGDKGILYLPVPWLPGVDGKASVIIHIAPDDTETRIEIEPKDPYLCEVEAMEAAILDGKALPYTLADSRQNVATIVALYESAATGKVVRLD